MRYHVQGMYLFGIGRFQAYAVSHSMNVGVILISFVLQNVERKKIKNIKKSLESLRMLVKILNLRRWALTFFTMQEFQNSRRELSKPL